MKKIVSSLLICSTLFSCVTPNLYCNAEDEKLMSAKTVTSSNNGKNDKIYKKTLKITVLELPQNENMILAKNVSLNDSCEDLTQNVALNDSCEDLTQVDNEVLKQAILDLAQDKNFTDQVIKNYTKVHEIPAWLKAVKILCLPFKACWYLIKKAFDYTLGKTISDKILPIIIASVTGLTIYKQVPWIQGGVDLIISFTKKIMK